MLSVLVVFVLMVREMIEISVRKGLIFVGVVMRLVKVVKMISVIICGFIKLK